jgi:hypothetical protein
MFKKTVYGVLALLLLSACQSITKPSLWIQNQDLAYLRAHDISGIKIPANLDANNVQDTFAIPLEADAMAAPTAMPDVAPPGLYERKTLALSAKQKSTVAQNAKQEIVPRDNLAALRKQQIRYAHLSQGGTAMELALPPSAAWDYVLQAIPKMKMRLAVQDDKGHRLFILATQNTHGRITRDTKIVQMRFVTSAESKATRLLLLTVDGKRLSDADETAFWLLLRRALLTYQSGWLSAILG